MEKLLGKEKAPKTTRKLDEILQDFDARKPLKAATVDQEVVDVQNDMKASSLVKSLQQLPLWPESFRGLPNTIARSGLFRITNKKRPREYLKKFKVASLNNIEVNYTGEELRTEDEDVFLQIMHIARMQELGERVEFTGYYILGKLGWGTSKKAYDRLRESLDRLSATNLEIKQKDDSAGYTGSLIRKFTWLDEDGGKLKKWCVWIEPEIRKLYAEKSFTLIDWEDRLKLTPTAKKLHGMYHTHLEPYPYKVQTLMELSESSMKKLYHWRADLKSALQELQDINFLESWMIQNDIVYVTRTKRRSN